MGCKLNGACNYTSTNLKVQKKAKLYYQIIVPLRVWTFFILYLLLHSFFHSFNIYKICLGCNSQYEQKLKITALHQTILISSFIILFTRWLHLHTSLSFMSILSIFLIYSAVLHESSHPIRRLLCLGRYCSLSVLFSSLSVLQTRAPFPLDNYRVL